MIQDIRRLPEVNDQNIARFFRSLTITLSMAFCLIVIAGCSSESDSRGERVGVEGTVLLDGEPLQNARIIFIGNSGQGQLKAIVSVTDGAFVFQTANGPLPGTNRIEIHPEAMDLEAFEAARGGDPNKKVDPKLIKIPAKYNTKSELTAEVKLDRDQNKFEFELTSK